MEKQILQLIGGTKRQYELLLISNYMSWCKIHAGGSDRMLQRILLDKSINHWYTTELKKLEQSFLNKNKEIQKAKYINYVLVKQQYYEHLQLLFRIYPKPLLEKFKPLTHQLKTFNHN